MKRSKRAAWKYGIIFPVVLLAVVFAIKKENKLQPAINPRKAEWPAEQDDEGYNIYRLKEGELIAEPNVYQNLLAEYERVMEDTLYTEEVWSNNIYDHVKRYIGKTQLYYCIKDLAGDDKPELILGTLSHGKYEVMGITYETGYEPFIIYTYDEEGIHWNCISEEYIMTIYKNGIVELISGGVWQHFMYEQVEKNKVDEKVLDVIVYAQTKDEEPHYYKYEIESGEYKDIPEEEFYNIRNQYTAIREELEWKPVVGFWKP